tara:strand:+ start:919 stop:1731 length:813 start_codon:yes stop_codon:yes gene_type:complete
MGINNIGDLNTWAHLKNLNVEIDQKLILSNINVNLNFGDNILVIGPNGSGKSTFLKLLNRSIYPINSASSSFKLFNKEDINIWDLRKNVGFLFKDMEERVNKGVKLKDLIISGFTGTFNSRYTKQLKKIDLDKINNLIIELDLTDIINQDFNLLSDGQKRRAMLARALVYQPKLLVLDEPFCNLDIKSNLILNQTLLKLINKSLNIIYVTHNLESILPQTNRVILMKEGKITDDGKPDELINSKRLSNLFNISIKVIKQDNYWRSIPLIK